MPIDVNDPSGFLEAVAPVALVGDMLQFTVEMSEPSTETFIQKTSPAKRTGNTVESNESTAGWVSRTVVVNSSITLPGTLEVALPPRTCTRMGTGIVPEVGPSVTW